MPICYISYNLYKLIIMLPLRWKNNIYQKKYFWKTKKWIREKPKFLFWKNILSWKRFIESNKDSFAILLPTLRSFFVTLSYAVTILLVLESYHKFFPTKIAVKEGPVISFLATIASVNGVFLGLYFTAASGIASSLLIKAKQDVRNFFFISPITTQYIKTIIITEIVSIFYILSTTAGYWIHPISLVFLSLLTAYIVFRFWSVGSNVFSSLEPEKSFPVVVRDIARSISAVTPKSFQWERDIFQNYQSNQSKTNLTLLENLIDFGIKHTHLPNKQLIIAVSYFFHILHYYSYQKWQIPTKSLWYKKKNKFENWVLANSSEISIALKTWTSLQPKMVIDFAWFEEEVLNICVRIFKWFKETGEIMCMCECIELFVQLCSVYWRNIDEKWLQMILNKLTLDINANNLVKIDSNNKKLYKEYLTLIDSESRMYIGGLLGLSNYLAEETSDNLVKTFSKINWRWWADQIYIAWLPFGMLWDLESIHSELKNEDIIEGSRVSKDWYIRTLLFRSYLSSLASYFKYIKTLHENYFQRRFNELLNKKLIWLAAELSQRWIEFSNKYEDLVERMNSMVSNCEQFHMVQDLPWTSFNFEEEKKEALSRQNEAIDKMIILLPNLRTISTEEDLPDFFWHAITIWLQACYQACMDNDHLRLGRIFPEIFLSSLNAYEIIKDKVRDWGREESKIVYSTEPLINMYEICGYIKIYAEFYQNKDLWKVAQDLWDIYLGKVENPKWFIEFIAAICNYRDSIFALMPQWELRMNWKMSFDRKMQESGFNVDYFYRWEESWMEHISPIIRVHKIWDSNARNIFFATYLSELPIAQGIDLPDGRGLKESIKHEAEKSKKS